MKITLSEYNEVVSNLRGHKGCIHCKKLQKEGEALCTFCKRPYLTISDFRGKIKQGEILVMAETGLMRGVASIES